MSHLDNHGDSMNANPFQMVQPPKSLSQRACCGWFAACFAIGRGEGIRPAPRSKVPEWVKGWEARMALEAI